MIPSTGWSSTRKTSVELCKVLKRLVLLYRARCVVGAICQGAGIQYDISDSRGWVVAVQRAWHLLYDRLLARQMK
jgi:hypothetical protein